MSYEEEEDEEEAELEEVVLKPTKTVWPTGSPSLVKGTESLTSAELQVPVPQMTYLASSVTHEKFVRDFIQETDFFLRPTFFEFGLFSHFDGY